MPWVPPFAIPFPIKSKTTYYISLILYVLNMAHKEHVVFIGIFNGLILWLRHGSACHNALRHKILQLSPCSIYQIGYSNNMANELDPFKIATPSTILEQATSSLTSYLVAARTIVTQVYGPEHVNPETIERVYQLLMARACSLVPRPWDGRMGPRQ